MADGEGIVMEVRVGEYLCGFDRQVFSTLDAAVQHMEDEHGWKAREHPTPEPTRDIEGQRGDE